MPTDDEAATIIDGSLRGDTAFEDLAVIRAALRQAGFAVSIDFPNGGITVERDPAVEPGGDVQLTEVYEGLSGREIVDTVTRNRDEQANSEDDPGSSQRHAAERDQAEPEQRDDGPERPDPGEDGDETTDTGESDDAGTEPSCDYCGRVCASNAGKASHERGCAANPENAAPDKEEEPDDEPQDSGEKLSDPEQRVQRLKDGIDDGTAYTSDELAAIACDKPIDAVTRKDRQRVRDLRNQGRIELESMNDPNRTGNAKLYYTGDRPEIETGEDGDEGDGRTYTCGQCDKEFDAPVPANPEHHDCPGESAEPASDGADGESQEEPTPPDETDGCDCPTDETGDPVHRENCEHYIREETAEMEDLYSADGSTAAPDDHGTDADTGESPEADDDDETLLDEMGPCDIGKIAVRGTFQRYECKCGTEFSDEQPALDHSDDTGHKLGWTAYDQVPKFHRKNLAKVSSPSTMR